MLRLLLAILRALVRYLRRQPPAALLPLLLASAAVAGCAGPIPRFTAVGTITLDAKAESDPPPSVEVQP